MVGVIGMSRVRRSALWLLLAVSLAAPIVFIVVRDHTPADGARISWYEDAWTAEGVLIDPIDAPAAGLEDGDLVLAVDDRSIEAWLAAVADPSVPRPHPTSRCPTRSGATAR